MGQKKNYCQVWFAPSDVMDNLLEKIKIRPEDGGYVIENVPCWVYMSQWKTMDNWPNILTQTFTGSCWYGTCTPYAVLWTAVLQEREKGGWTYKDGLQIQARAVRERGDHSWAEIYIKGKGYFVLDVGWPFKFKPQTAYRKSLAAHMANRFCCSTESTPWFNFVPYDGEWAGVAPTPPVTPSKTQIKATTSPTGARIWLKKH